MPSEKNDNIPSNTALCYEDIKIVLLQYLEIVQIVLNLKSYRADKLLDVKTHLTGKSNLNSESPRIKTAVKFPSFKDLLRTYKFF